MKLFLSKIILFLCIVVIIDIGFGIICDFLTKHAPNGKSKRFHDLLINDCHDVLILGSSRAHHHYDPRVMESALKLDCYNAGYDGNGVMLAYPLLVNILDRCKPQILVFDIEKTFDIMVNPNDGNNTRYISRLKPYYRIPVIERMIQSVSFNNYIQVHSAMYRYNSKLLPLLMDYILVRNSDIKGFAPLHGTKRIRARKKYKEGKIDPLKLYWLKKFAELKKERELNMIWVLSPKYYQDLQGHDDYKIARDIAISHNIPFLDYYLDQRFIGHDNIFYDATHMNEIGARLFTEQLVEDLKNFL